MAWIESNRLGRQWVPLRVGPLAVPAFLSVVLVLGISFSDGGTSAVSSPTMPVPRPQLSSFTRLRGGSDQYDSTKAKVYDQVLWDILDKHPDEIFFLNTVFNFLQRRTPCFNGEHAERNYNILIDTLTSQRKKYLEQVSKGANMKPPQPMNATKRTGPKSRPSKPTPRPEPTPPVSSPQIPKSDNYKEIDLTEHEQEKTPPGTQVPINNGGRTDKYVWTQTLKELSVEVFLPKGIGAKQLDVKFSTHHLCVGIKGTDQVILNGTLDEDIKATESYWTVEEDILQLSMVKAGDMTWWKRILKGDAKIDVKKIEPENSNLSDLTPDLRQTVEKMMYDQRQKAMGKPTADESRNQEMMKKFMAQHPEMDFSQCKFGG